MSLWDNPLGELRVPLTWAAAIALVVAVVAATAILLSDRRETFKAEATKIEKWGQSAGRYLKTVKLGDVAAKAKGFLGGVGDFVKNAWDSITRIRMKSCITVSNRPK